MSNTFTELLLAFFSAMGVFSLLWLLFGRLLVPAPSQAISYAVIPLSGDAEEAEHLVHHLLWLQGGRLIQIGRAHV